VAPLAHEPDVELTQMQLKERAIEVEEVAFLGSQPDLLLLGLQSQHLLRRLGQLVTGAKRYANSAVSTRRSTGGAFTFVGVPARTPSMRW
jgi:hypothetical protein